MKPKKINNKWYIETYTKEFVHVFLLEKRKNFPVPAISSSEKEAFDYIKRQNK